MALWDSHPMQNNRWWKCDNRERERRDTAGAIARGGTAGLIVAGAPGPYRLRPALAGGLYRSSPLPFPYAS
jgi:hypothetical protein